MSPNTPEAAKPSFTEVMDLACEYFTFRGNSHGNTFFPTSLTAKTDPASALEQFAHALLQRWGTPQSPPEPGYEKGFAQEHLARLMRDALSVETNHNVYICAAGKILDRPEFFDYVVPNAAPNLRPVPGAEVE